MFQISLLSSKKAFTIIFYVCSFLNLQVALLPRLDQIDDEPLFLLAVHGELHGVSGWLLEQVGAENYCQPSFIHQRDVLVLQKVDQERDEVRDRSLVALDQVVEDRDRRFQVATEVDALQSAVVERGRNERLSQTTEPLLQQIAGFDRAATSKACEVSC